LPRLSPIEFFFAAKSVNVIFGRMGYLSPEDLADIPDFPIKGVRAERWAEMLKTEGSNA
jgi:hypothetical protein